MPLTANNTFEYPLPGKYHKMTLARTMISVVLQHSILGNIAPFKFSIFKFQKRALEHFPIPRRPTPQPLFAT